jgi:S-adenosylmethionine:diacylglycerol 3-amino-3-carboxypropyl transferase
VVVERKEVESEQVFIDREVGPSFRDTVCRHRSKRRSSCLHSQVKKRRG